VNHSKYSVFAGLCSSQKHKVEVSTLEGPGIDLVSEEVCRPSSADVSAGVNIITDCRLQILDLRLTIVNID
jgi:hypothetical protein